MASVEHEPVMRSRAEPGVECKGRAPGQEVKLPLSETNSVSFFMSKRGQNLATLDFLVIFKATQQSNGRLPYELTKRGPKPVSPPPLNQTLVVYILVKLQ